MSVGPSELIVIVIVVLLLFGSRRIAALGKGLGEGIREFKRGIAGQDGHSAPTPQSEPLPGDSGAEVTTQADTSESSGASAEISTQGTESAASEAQPAPTSKDQSPTR